MSLPDAMVMAAIGAGAETVTLDGPVNGLGCPVWRLGVSDAPTGGQSPDAILGLPVPSCEGAAWVADARASARILVVFAVPVLPPCETVDAMNRTLGLHVFADATVGRVDVDGQPWWLVRGRCR